MTSVQASIKEGNQDVEKAQQLVEQIQDPLPQTLFLSFHGVHRGVGSGQIGCRHTSLRQPSECAPNACSACKVLEP